MQITLKNDTMTATFDSHGAELKSIIKDDREYMWNGDPAFWNRTSPVLFPFVGALRDGKYRYKEKEYTMGQHGFARDMEFEEAGHTSTSASFRLKSNEETLKKYPFNFELTIMYSLNKNNLEVMWLVKNPSDETMYFSIGAHPAFMVKTASDGTIKGNYLQFDAKEDLTATDFADGLVQRSTHILKLDEDRCFPLDEHTFDNGVHILEHDQVQSVSILDINKKPYVTVEFDSPLVGIWAPEKKNAPFLCIEPWYGRADACDFDGELSERRYERYLGAGTVFRGGYKIILN
ncbi:MAG: aldose 1-epimerase family protein [Eubacterium sp.]|nr:aldose 1-epimerase family protein [Eubacterium sp.]